MAQSGNNSGPVRRSDAVYDGLFEAIQQGTFAKGSRLPTETALAQEFGVSRPTVREALARLREDGLVFSRQGSGAFVENDPSPIAHIAPLASIDDLRRCFEYRIGLESEAARLAAVNRSDEEITQLRGLYHAMGASNAEGENGAALDFAFHLAIAKASGNRFIVAGLEQVRRHIAQGMSINRTLSLESTDRLALAQAEHKQIIDCLEQKNSSKAADAMAAHLRNAMVRFLGSE